MGTVGTLAAIGLAILASSAPVPAQGVWIVDAASWVPLEEVRVTAKSRAPCKLDNN